MYVGIYSVFGKWFVLLVICNVYYWNTGVFMMYVF